MIIYSYHLPIYTGSMTKGENYENSILDQGKLSNPSID